jgi:replicative superfamily II helicase
VETNEKLPVAGTIDERFTGMFPYISFNRMQSIAVPAILGSDANVVVSAPTASGKTVLAEAAMVRELSRKERGKVLFIAPLRALTNEKESEWKRILSGIGFKVYVVTGERELFPSEARSADVIITTPEKWDSATRKYQQERYAFVRDVALVVVDEVHLLDSDSRGGTLEAVISRMRRISALYDKRLRIVALSATMPNIGDVARWINAGDALEFDASYRPVDLETEVLAYYPKKNDFLNKYVRLYKAFDLIKDELGDGHQALIFVSTRQDTQQAAEKLCEVVRKQCPYMLEPFEAIKLQEIKNKATNSKLKSCIPCGIAFHHAGLSAEDKSLIEGGFREGLIRILASTSTLAWGVNLPARVVVVRDIEMYDPIQGNKDISAIDLLQMLGRAGRPGYDTMGKGYVIVPYDRAKEYKALLKDGKTIESMLEHSLAEHLNAEIAVGMVKNAADAAEWLRTTFYYVRSQGRGSPLDVGAISATRIKYLVRNGFVSEEAGVLTPTPLGRITSDFYLKLETALLFREHAMKGTLSTEDVLDIVARAAEFSDVATRPGEASSLKAFGIEAGPGGMAKVKAILAGLIGRTLPDELRSDAWAIKQNASRLLSAFSRFCEQFSGESLSRKVKMVSLQIDKGIPEEAVELASIEGVGERSLDILMGGGIRSLRDAATKTPEDLVKMGIKGSVAIEIVDTARKLPKADVDISGIPAMSAPGPVKGTFTVRNVGAGGKLALSVKAGSHAIIDERLYLGHDGSKSVSFEYNISDDTEILIKVEYVDTLLPADEWKTTINMERAVKSEPIKENVIREAMRLTPGKYFVIAGEAGVKYEGRANDSYDGSVVVLIKPDSTVVVHTDRGVHPRNYMGRAHVSQSTDTNGMKILAESNGEKLSISFKSIGLFQSPFDAKLEPQARIVKPAEPNLSEGDKALEKALRDARSAKARELKVPPYTIFQDKTIYDLVSKKPKTKEELTGIYGIGEAKAGKYGDLILKVLSGEP